MAFDNDDFHAPEYLRADGFLLRPIRASDVELDYEAVMESREFLRTWGERSTWPEDDFTVEVNREDLDELERRHAGGESFTYTVMNPTETQCLGCVYIFPTDSPVLTRTQIKAIGDADWSEYGLAVHFWIRASKPADELDRTLLDALGLWFEREWQVGHHLVITNEQFEQQVAMIEGTDLGLRFELEDPRAAGKYRAYA